MAKKQMIYIKDYNLILVIIDKLNAYTLRKVILLLADVTDSCGVLFLL